MKVIPNIRYKQAVILSVVVVAILASWLFVPDLLANHTDNRLKAHDVTQTNGEMTAARKALVPLLNSLRIQLSQQVDASCSPGDPSLYAHSCGSQAKATYTGNIKVPQDAVITAQNLQTLDAGLKSNGWKYDGNDFRSQ